MIADAAFGFAEHGHLYGSPALVIRLSAVAERAIPVSRVVSMAATRPGCLVYLFVVDARSLLTACELANGPFTDGYTVSACVRPGMQIRDDRLAYASVLRVMPGDWRSVRAQYLDERVGSVSFHSWPGGDVLERVATKVPAPLGRFLHLHGEDVGHAKVWLQGERKSLWRLTPPHPLNDLEPAEIAEMAAPSRHAVA
jgi:hypothetical protein